MKIHSMVLEIDCRQVWKELTNYMEGDLSQEMRDRITRHLQGCKHCTAIYDGARNIMRLLGHKESIELPQGFSERLFNRLMLHSREQGPGA